jgi:hypothetical protein
MVDAPWGHIYLIHKLSFASMYCTTADMHMHRFVTKMFRTGGSHCAGSCRGSCAGTFAGGVFIVYHAEAIASN